MAITLDSDSEATTNVTPLTFNHTAANGAKIVIISIAVNGSGVGALTVTYGGVACTQINVTSRVIDVNNTIGSALYYLASPPAGTNTVSVGYSASSPKIAANASSWLGEISPGDPFFDKAKANGGTNTPTVDCPTEPGNVVVDACGVWRAAGGATITVDSSQTQIANQTIGAAGLGIVHGCSYETATSSTTTMSWSITTLGSNEWCLCTVAIKEEASRLLGQLGNGQ